MVRGLVGSVNGIRDGADTPWCRQSRFWGRPCDPLGAARVAPWRRLVPKRRNP